MYFGFILLFLIIIYIFFEFRLRKPDEVVLFESSGEIKKRTGRLYPRHFSLAISARAYFRKMTVEADAAGKLGVRISLAFSAAMDKSRFSELIRLGGWQKECVDNAVNEAQILVEAQIKEYCEKIDVDQLSSEKLSVSATRQLKERFTDLGLDLISFSVQNIEPIDQEIVLALQRKEESRIKEITSQSEEKARININKVKLKADEQIASADHELALKKIKLKKEQELREAEIADLRTDNELKRKKALLDFEKLEMRVLQNHPELIMLSPQLARLIQAGQQLPNAQTVVSLSGNEISGSGQVIDTLQMLLKKLLDRYNTTSADEK